MIRRPPRSTHCISSAASDVYRRQTLWDTVKGAIAGFEEGGIVGGISGAIKGFFNSLITAPLDMLKDAVAWVLDLFGFENAAKVLDSFSFTDTFNGLSLIHI